MTPAERRARDFGKRAKWIPQHLPCCVAGCNNPPAHTHHVKSRGAGGRKRDQVSICWLHHVEIHARGKVTFERLYGLNLEKIAAQTALLYDSLLIGPTAEPERSEPGVAVLPPAKPTSSPPKATGSAAGGFPK